MDRPIIVLTQQPGKSLELAYLGTDAAAAEKVFDEKSNDAVNDSVGIFYYPHPRIVRHPSTEAQIIADSLATQKNSQRERIRAEARAEAERRLTAELKADIAKQAEAEAEAAVRAAEEANASDLEAGQTAVGAADAEGAEKAKAVAKQAVSVIIDSIKEGVSASAAAESEKPAAAQPAVTADAESEDEESEDPANRFAPPKGGGKRNHK